MPKRPRKKKHVVHRRLSWVEAEYARDQACRYCGEKMTRQPNQANTLTVDHVVPLSCGGPNRIENKTLACWRCNTLKGNMDGDEFRQAVREWKANGGIPKLSHGSPRRPYARNEAKIMKMVALCEGLPRSHRRKLEKAVRDGYADEMFKGGQMREALVKAGLVDQ